MGGLNQTLWSCPLSEAEVDACGFVVQVPGPPSCARPHMHLLGGSDCRAFTNRVLRLGVLRNLPDNA